MLNKSIKALIIVIILIIFATFFIFIKNKQKNGPEFVLEEATIQSVHVAIKQHTITCEQLINLYIDRIKKYNLSVDETAPINAIAKINVNVIDQARELDRIYAKGQMAGPLHCIPVLLKDNIDSYDSPSISGSLSLLGNQPTQDAFLTKKLRDAGAVILGKSTMDEFAAGVAGISGANGRTGNVYDTSKNSGGSSGGSAVAVSANFVMIGIGTDNSGSIRIPAAFNGIFGLRPSTGLISQRGIFPRGNMDSVAGPLTRNVEDLAILLDVIAQPDNFDKKTLRISRPKTYTAYLKTNSFQGKRIGVVQTLGKLDTFKDMPSETRTIFQNSLMKIQEMGATIIPDINLTGFNLESKLNQAGEREDVNAYLAAYPAVKKDYYAICESNRTRVFGTSMECLEFIRSFPKKFGTEYRKALKMFEANDHYIEKTMNQYHLDALLIPVSSTGSATYISKSMMSEALASNAGLPAIALNGGYTHDHMPVGIELIGKRFSEGELIGMAYAYEKHSLPRERPIMPEMSTRFDKFDIPHYNNLLMLIGYDTYKKILAQSAPGKFYQSLTPEKFRIIVENNIDLFDNN